MATIISSTEQGPFVSHIPLILEKKPDGLSLIGHLARGNPHWKLLDNKSVYVIFHGPNAYITPKWYEKNDVPTWSYAVVHINGTSSLIHDLAAPGVIERSIVGFEIKIFDLKSKFKLNQTLSKASIDGCIKGLRSHSHDTNNELAEMIARSWGL